MNINKKWYSGEQKKNEKEGDRSQLHCINRFCYGMVMKKNQRLIKIGDPDNNSKERKKKITKKKSEKKNGGAETKNGTHND